MYTSATACAFRRKMLGLILPDRANTRKRQPGNTGIAG